VLFGGGGPEWPPRSDTWLWDGTRWAQGPAPPVGLSGRTGARMAYDPDIHKVVLFGGAGEGMFTDTWFFDGSRWTQGQSAPSGMAARVFFGMDYVPKQHAILVAGGDGGADAWWFDGSAWSPAPSLGPVGAKERFDLVYDPQLGGPVVIGGIGPGPATSAMYWLRNSRWLKVPHVTGQPWPEGRLDGWIVWDPVARSLLYGGGIDDVDGGKAFYDDVHTFVEIPPTASSPTLTPSDPGVGDPITVTYANVTGGYKTITPKYRWTINGTKVAGANTDKLTPGVGGFDSGDIIQAKVMLTDALGKKSGWLRSGTVTIGDRPPTIGSCTIDPTVVYVTSAPDVTCSGVKDPDGDPVTLHYAWTVNGDPVGTDSPNLPNSSFTANDSIDVTVTPVDDHGAIGTPASADPEVVLWNVTATGTASPAGNLPIRGGGFGTSEQVDVRLDSPTGPLVATIGSDTNGTLPFTNVAMPSPLAGGQHMVYGVGRTSGTVGRGPATIVPTASISPKTLAAGDVTTFTGNGYVPNQTVTISFPGGAPVQKTAAADGSVKASVTSPREPYPGDVVTGASSSGSASDTYRTSQTLTAPASAHPQDVVPVHMTGYQAGETVDVSFDGGATAASYTADATGSADASLALKMLFGSNHSITAAGATSHVSKVTKIDLPAWVGVAPNNGPVGTKITVTSGPGWSPGEKIQIMWGSSLIKTVTVDASGSLPSGTSFAAPQHAPGGVTVKLKEVTTIVGATPTATFTITASLSPNGITREGTWFV
jgi:hypothetical protein